jgi:hypothetical protein
MEVPEVAETPKGTVVYYTPAEVSKLIKFHPSTIRRLFGGELGVVRVGHGQTRRKRAYVSIRIPDYVLHRVLRRLQAGQR